MWLLSTDRAELRYFANNYEATGGYAILSHTWAGDEQTLQDVREIGERCRAIGTNPRDDPGLSAKIRNCCIIAEKHGYRWVWIDSCCIDKRSSSELSEAINSMFRWYEEADVCFAFLADVPSDCIMEGKDSAFRESRWHTRGWTLQELIAPDFLIFLSADWDELGNRADLAELLQEITRVPARVLTGEAPPARYSVSIRMSWASNRKTTRVEDEAYCLMGLFGVNMPTNYGEDKQAFIRLQYEIMQRDPDMSVFAFGYCHKQDDDFTLNSMEVSGHKWKYLLADSPREFDSGFVYIPDVGRNVKRPYPPPVGDPQSADPFDGGVELPRVAVTSYGVELRIPIYEADGIAIAVILCTRNGRNVGLFLTRDGQGKDPRRPRYFTGCSISKVFKGVTRLGTARLVDLGDDLHNLTFKGKNVKASWRTIHVVPASSDLDSRTLATSKLMINCSPASAFRVPHWLIARFTALQFFFRQVENTETLQVLDIFLDGVVQIYVSFGSCIRHNDGFPTNKPAQLWAKVDVLQSYIWMDTFTHDCSEDHIDSKSWATRSKLFGDADRGVRLSLIPSTRTSDSPFVIHLELLGRILERKLKGAGEVSIFPSLEDLERDTPRPTPNLGPPPSSQSPSQLPPTQPKPSRNSSAGSTATLHRWFPSVPCPSRKRGLDSPIPALESKLRTLTLDGPTPEGAPAAENEVGSNMAAQQDHERDE